MIGSPPIAANGGGRFVHGAAVPLAALGVALLVGCGGSQPPPTLPDLTPTSGAPSQFTATDQRFLAAVSDAVPQAEARWGDAALVVSGYSACARLNAEADNPEADDPEAVVSSVAADVRDDAAARAIVRAAADNLCPIMSDVRIAASAPPKAATLTTFGPGMYQIGAGEGQVEPGQYISAGPSGGVSCYYARLENNNGNPGDIVAEALSQGPAIVNVKQSDGYLQVRGCTFSRMR